MQSDIFFIISWYLSDAEVVSRTEVVIGSTEAQVSFEAEKKELADKRFFDVVVAQSMGSNGLEVIVQYDSSTSSIPEVMLGVGLEQVENYSYMDRNAQ